MYKKNRPAETVWAVLLFIYKAHFVKQLPFQFQYVGWVAVCEKTVPSPHPKNIDFC